MHFGLIKGVASCALVVAFATPLTAGDKDAGIIVTGKSLKETEAELKACIARGCPPDEEIRTALAHAENQFIDGEYRDAKTTLYKTVGRNRKYSSDYPIEVSDLFRARGRVAEHLGEPDDYRLATLDMRDILRKNLPADDARSMVAQIEVGESRAKLGYPQEANRIFADVAVQASAAGHERVAAYATLRRLLIEYEMARDTDSVGGQRKAVAGLRQLADNPHKGAEEFAMVAEVVLARFDRQAGKKQSTDAIIKRFAEKGGATRPILLSGEAVKIPDGVNVRSGLEELSTRAAGSAPGRLGATVSGSTTLAMLPGSFEDRWLDVGFWVNPNGLVSDVEVLRSSGELHWAKWVTNAIKSRLYVPLSTTDRDASPGFYMIERYTYTSHYLSRSATTGTRLQTRSPNARIERLDITPENYDQPFTLAKPTAAQDGR